ncbi:TonB-dependent receptor [Duganella sp. Root336D2]|uniref:TonB-dependent receptor n=1 Tax=Duganella sp. Root336D2 TaxID=1736518 RepID=UPI0006F2D01D|nr:TonB-dependent receptor [Duganella sp. Root336D2]KQV54010.1 TonB-denpendent receptor [Duganella sp. Root336D2]
MNSRSPKRRTALACACLLAPAAAYADDPFTQRVLVEGARASQVGVADSAGMGSVTQRQLEARTIYRPGELLEATPGLVASQHSGEGKANQFYLRGFNLDHGTDLRTTVDGMPVNQRSHAHGQGWTDLNFIIPELVARLDYSKGPYNAGSGDFSSAGATAIHYSSRLPQDQASTTAGQNGYGRALLAGSRESGASGAWLYALETVHSDGPYTRGDNYRKLNAVLRYSEGFANNGYAITAMAYRGAWNATDQIPQRAVDSGLLGRFDGIDPTDGGLARRFSLSAGWARSDDKQTSRANAYIINNRLELFSNFTYFLDDPVHGDQFAQPDRRVTSGFDLSHSWHDHMDDMAWSTTLGLQAQNDNIFNALQRTAARQVLATVRADHIVETSAALYLQQRLRVTSWLRGEAGVRLDRYRFAVGDARADKTLASPSISLAFGPWSRSEFYLNAGRGFHSNDARGVTQAQDPATPLARSRGLELGLRSEAVKGLQTVLALYRLDFDSELVYLGDAGSTEAGRPSRRYGIEFSNYYKPFKWLSLDADLAFARGRLQHAAPEGDRIPGAVEGVAQLAATFTPAGPWSGALRLRWFGPRPLVEDNSVRSKASAIVNSRLAYKLAARTTLELEAFNLANRRVSAIDYFYESRLKGESGPSAGIHFHPVEARSFRLSLNCIF